MAEHLRLDHLADAEHILRMIDALFGADLADVNQALDAVGDLHKRAELHELGHRPFDLRADTEPACNVGPWVGQRLLESERDAAFFGLDAENNRIDACRPA